MSSYTRFDHRNMEKYDHVDGIKYRLAYDLNWKIGHVTGPVYIVPKGFIFDVTVPIFLRWLFNPHDVKFLKAAALHDHMIHESEWSRITAAAEFHNALKASKVGRWKRLVMFLAVVLWKYS